MVKNNPLKFRLFDITEFQSSSSIDGLAESKKFSIAFNFTFGVNIKRRAILCKVKFKFLNQNKSPFFYSEYGYHFLFPLSSWKDLYDKENKIVTIPKNLAIHFLMISVSTSRGIIYSKSTFIENSQKIILPLLTLQNVVKNDIVIKIP